MLHQEEQTPTEINLKWRLKQAIKILQILNNSSKMFFFYGDKCCNLNFDIPAHAL